MTSKVATYRTRGSSFISVDSWDESMGNSHSTLPDAFYKTIGINLNGDDNPAYKSLIKNRVNATNALTASETQYFGNGLNFFRRVSSYGMRGNPPARTLIHQDIEFGGGNYDLVGNPGTSPADSSVADRAKARFVSKARSLQSPAQGGVILGELKETLHMLRHPADAIRGGLSKYLKDVKKRLKGKKVWPARKKNSIVASTWLEYTFGWSPFVADIQAAGKAIANLVEKPPENRPVRAFDTKTSIVVDGLYDVVSPPGGGSAVSYLRKQDSTTSVYLYGALNDRSDLNSVPVLSAFGLRPHDIAPTIWELIPYSFVLDYFTNIGDIISSASFNTSYLSWWAMTTTVVNRQIAYDYHDVTSYSSGVNTVVTGSSSGSGGIFVNKSISRVNFPSLVPSLRFRIPGSPKVGFNLAALFAQSRSFKP